MLDEDQLNEALTNGDITQADFELAYDVANQIMNGIAQDVTYLSNRSNNDYKFFKSSIRQEDNEFV